MTRPDPVEGAEGPGPPLGARLRAEEVEGEALMTPSPLAAREEGEEPSPPEARLRAAAAADSCPEGVILESRIRP